VRGEKMNKKRPMKRPKKDTSVAWKFLFISIIAYFMAWPCSEMTGISFALWWLLIMAMAIVDGIVWKAMNGRVAKSFFTGYMYGQYVRDPKERKKPQ
jgi:hypothetical protein